MDAASFEGSHRWQWRERLIRWVVPRLAGSDDAKETTLEMVTAAMSAAHAEGVEDAAIIVERMADAAKNDQRAVLDIAAKALRKLIALNAAPSPSDIGR